MESKKLTIDQLNPYLPHKVKVMYKGIVNGEELKEWEKQDPNSGSVYFQMNDNWEWLNSKPDEVIGDKIGYIKRVNFWKSYTSLEVGIKSHGLKTVGLGSVKPILRPLSELIEDYKSNDGDCRKYMVSSSIIYNIGNKFLPSNIPWDDLDYLCSFHFDVFGLLEQNLAIDINTIELL